MKSLVRRAVMAVFVCLAFANCAGYHIGPVQPKFMAGIHSILIPTFRNDTLYPRIEALVTDEIIRQFQQDGTYKMATSDDDADAILEGEITQIRRNPSRSVIGDVQATQEFSLNLTIHYKITRKATGLVIEDRSISGTTKFFVSGDVNQDERQAIPLATENAAVSMLAELSEGW